MSSQCWQKKHLNSVTEMEEKRQSCWGRSIPLKKPPAETSGSQVPGWAAEKTLLREARTNVEQDTEMCAHGGEQASKQHKHAETCYADLYCSHLDSLQLIRRKQKSPVYVQWSKNQANEKSNKKVVVQRVESYFYFSSRAEFQSQGGMPGDIRRGMRSDGSPTLTGLYKPAWEGLGAGGGGCVFFSSLIPLNKAGVK